MVVYAFTLEDALCITYRSVSMKRNIVISNATAPTQISTIPYMVVAEKKVQVRYGKQYLSSFISGFT